MGWLNNKTVQEQIGVDMTWESCNTLVNVRLESDWMKDYQQLITGPIEDNVRALIYAGDLDFICNWLGNQAWSLSLPWNGQRAMMMMMIRMIRMMMIVIMMMKL